VLVGQGPEKEKLREIVQQKGLQNVSFLPSVPKSEIPNILNLMDVLYIGLKKESLFRFGVSPNKLMDYMMAGKPIIHAIDAGNDMVSDCNCGISVPPEDPLAIKNAIIKLFDMTTEEKTAMGARGKEYVMSQHDYKVLAKRSLEHRH
jgi:glycosyltransferase involved in cell wall biosynthesis